MSSSGATEAQLKSEIERLTATINRHKASQTKKSWHTGSNYYAPYPQGGRSNTYVNPNYKPANKYIRPGLNVAGPSKPPSTATASTSVPSANAAAPMQDTTPTPQVSGQKKEVVLGGVAFESSRRSLVRKDLPKPPSIAKPKLPITQAPYYSRKPGHIHAPKPYKVKARRGRNMTLNNTRRPYPYVVFFLHFLTLMMSADRSSRKAANKRINKYVDKPCPRFTTTGACSRGLTCMYQHDPAKIAICWNFLQDNCSKTAETCNLSHEPTPERTPLCVHFLNNGRCTREKCPFPHVNVGQREGICRDFAVLGYCERGLECDRQHVRECPDFAENGTCSTKGCKLPHVIRANRNRKLAAPAVSAPASTAEDGQLGDEFISLTFKESDSEEDDEEDNEEEEGEEESDSEDDDSETGDIEVNM
ncbi:hypothetical protein CPC08DRAFT_439709 [Agrocybe pediades]|nr:hypothetical protein CPC08DRAFT_439709 [Agrocybe pediades]